MTADSHLVGAASLLAAAAAALALTATWPRWHPAPAPALVGNPAPAAPLVPATTGVVDDQAWERLGNEQRALLAPLALQWAAMTSEQRKKWLTIAEEANKMPGDQRSRVQQRIARWAALTPDERRHARENFQLTRNLPAVERERAWKAYQRLPERQRSGIAARQERLPRSAVSAPPSGSTGLHHGVRNALRGRQATRAVAPRGASAPASGSAVPAGASATLPSRVPARPQPATTSRGGEAAASSASTTGAATPGTPAPLDLDRANP